VSEAHRAIELIDDIPDPFDIAEIFRKRRKELKMTQQELAKQVGVSRQTIARFENKNFGDIGFSVVIRIAEALGLTFDVRESNIAMYREGKLRYQDNCDPSVAKRVKRVRRAIQKVQEVEQQSDAFTAATMLRNGEISRMLNEEMGVEEDEEDLEAPGP